MKIIPAELLLIPENRQRRTFDEKRIQDLASSILSKGLMHPPVCRFDGENYVLVAGERRTRALRSIHLLDVSIQCNDQTIPAGSFPVTLLGDLPPLALREAELEENTIRVDLSWQEQASAIAELDALRADQKEAAGLPHSARATASEIIGREAQGSEITKVTDAIIVSKHLHDPDVMKAKTTKEAMKVIRKKAEAAHREVLAENFNPEESPHNAILGSCFTYAKALPDAFFDCILTDPPYGIGADGFGDMAGTTHDYSDTEDYALTCYQLVAHEGFRVAKPEAHLYAFLDPRLWHQISFEFTVAGWDVWPTPLIWNKLNGMLPKPEHGPRRTYEMILFATKGKKKVHKVGADILTFPLLSDRDHGAQKPVPLYSELLSRSCYPGDTVLDFFMGSGTIFPAANRAKLAATGMEINKEYYHLALSRLSGTEDVIEDSLLQLGF
jgi:DNA modification methylase/ParB-like chromosome segregation protein Spo0J